MDRIDKIAKTVVSKVKIASEPSQTPWTYKEQGQIASLVGAANSVQENLKLWLNFYKSGEAEKYGYDCKSGIASTTKLLTLCANMKKQLEEAKKAMIAFENAL